jgi:hypothetical protein
MEDSMKPKLLALSLFLLANTEGIAAAQDPLSLRAKAPTVGPVGGQPAPGTKQSVPDLEYQIKYQRAFEAIIWGMPALSINSFTRAINAVGAQSNDIVAYSQPANERVEALTANNQVPYTTGYSDLSKGPAVLEVPAATDVASFFGQVVGTWQTTVADVGPTGLDKGKGGKYLLVPPGYSEPIPKGYFVINTGSNVVWFAFRALPGPKGDLVKAGQYIRDGLRLYPLSQAANPPKQKFIDPAIEQLRFPSLPFYDLSAFEMLHKIINAEPILPRDKVMMDMLASIGIEKGKPFNPDAKAKKAMEAAVADAYFYMLQANSKPDPNQRIWKDRNYYDIIWTDKNGEFSFDYPDLLAYTARALTYFQVTFFPKKWDTARPVNAYISPKFDKQGNPFLAGKNYKVTIPKTVPVKFFWAVNMYDDATGAFIYNPLARAGLSNFDRPKMKINPDESVTIYIGPKAPPGLESNWIPTQGKKPFMLIRLYGAEEAYFNRSFVLDDFELVDY